MLRIADKIRRYADKQYVTREVAGETHPHRYPEWVGAGES
jgi:hypothetical protein